MLFPPATETPVTDLPEGWFFHPNTADLICTDNEIINITTKVYRSCNSTNRDESPLSITPSYILSTSTSAVAPDDISPTPTTLQTNTVGPVSSESSFSTMDIEGLVTTPVPAVSVASTPVPAVSGGVAACSSNTVEVFCTLTAALTTPTTSAPTSPPCSCNGDFGCERCVNYDCMNPRCPICCSIIYSACSKDCRDSRQKRYALAVEDEVRLKRDTSNTLLPEGWFYPNPDNTRLACIHISDIESATEIVHTPSTSTPSTTTASVSGQSDPSVHTPTCQSELIPLDGTFPLLELSTVCSPLEDPFNPCEDLLGRNHALQLFIWVVIIIALVGNFLVVLVFLGYVVIIKRTRVKFFVVHFFYFNLAIADFLMGIYLLTIAIQDISTLGNFSMFDVSWRTEGGCDFAGFCAITSTMVSVYVLLVITIERLYTFSRALKKSHTSKTTATILMAVGWGFGVLVGILPVVTKDVNDYTRTAICLPFDVSSKLALSYILFLLLFTGVVFMIMAICYIITFFQVFYCHKAERVNDKEWWKTELKVALRMGSLVLTNLISWFPIALLGISAALGYSLVDNITFAKWVMVFIFPINACLNPILYSILSKVFRDNLVLILGKCGLCGSQVSKIRRHRAGFTSSVINYNRNHASSDTAKKNGENSA